MKTTVDLPEHLFKATRSYAQKNGKTFKEVLVESLERTVGTDLQSESRPGWERFFGVFRGDPAIEELEAIIASEFSRIDAEGWK